MEAEHAAEVRRLRGGKGWITGASRGDLPAFTQAVYDGEANTMQASINVSSLAGSNGGVDAATEALDEPLTKAQVVAIVTPFLA